MCPTLGVHGVHPAGPRHGGACGVQSGAAVHAEAQTLFVWWRGCEYEDWNHESRVRTPSCSRAHLLAGAQPIHITTQVLQLFGEQCSYMRCVSMTARVLNKTYFLKLNGRGDVHQPSTRLSLMGNKSIQIAHIHIYCRTHQRQK